MSMHRRVASDKFLIPQLQMEANTEQLSRLKKNMLAHHYDRQIQQKQHRSQRAHTLQNPQNTSLNKNISYRELNQMERDYQRSIKTDLASEYKQIIAQHQIDKMKQQERKEKQDKEYIQGLRNLQSLEKLKKQSLQQKYKQNMQEYLNQEKQHQRQKAEQRLREKQQFNRRYGKAGLTNIRRGMPEKQKSFRDHYDNVMHSRQEIQRNYIAKWSAMANSRDNEKDRLIQKNIAINKLLQQQRLKKQVQTQQKLKHDFLGTLAEQVREKSLRKQQQKSQHRNQRYTQEQYRRVHHPINNPIDFRVTHDNKYILKQLQEEQQYQKQSMSVLAKNGSHLLL